MTTEFQREQQERRETLENDKRLREQGKERGSTFAQFAESEATEIHGRFAGREKSVVVGSTANPGAAYPQGPVWSSGDQELEPPLGQDVNAMVPTGEAHEVAASIERSGEASLGSGPPDGEGCSVAPPASMRPRRSRSKKRTKRR